MRRSDSHHKPGGSSYWIYGQHAVQAALGNPRRKILKLYVTAHTRQEAPQYLWQRHRPEEVTPERMQQILPTSAVHQGIAAQVQKLPEQGIESVYPQNLKEKNCIVILDQVTDPQNVGAVMRSAAAFGADAVIVPEHHSPEESGVLAKAASGALEILPLIRVQNLVQAIKELKDHGFWCIGLEGSAKGTIDSLQDYKRVALLLGAEGKGLRRLTREHCDMLARIPISDEMESLNVSNAAAVALYALSR